MQIQIEPHTLQRANERGASEEEIKETLLNGNFISVKNNRLGKSKVFILILKETASSIKRRRLKFIM